MKKKILFLCTGNSCRSQMAEGFMRKFGGDRFEGYSAGLKPARINPSAIKVMNEAGIDISGQRSSAAEQYADEKFDYIVTVCDNARASCPVYPGEHEDLHWDLADPAEAVGTEEDILNVFRKTRDRIKVLVKDFAANK